jgi:predicted secreted acid phosphatase
MVNNNSIYANNYYNYYAYRLGNAANVTLNASNNWWGTTVIADIEATILDNSDNACYALVVNIDPILVVAP